MAEEEHIGTIASDVVVRTDGVKSARATLARELTAMGVALDRLADESEKSSKRQEEALKRSVNRGELARQTAELKKVAAARKELMESTAHAMKLAAIGIGGALAISVKQAMDFDKALRNVNSIAKLNERSFQGLRKNVLALTNDDSIVDGPQNLAAGLVDIYSAGFKGSKALEILSESAKGATAGLTTTKVGADVLTSALNSNIKGATDAKTVMNVLFQTVNDGKVTFEELAGSLGAVLPTASQAGISIQEVGAAVAVMTAKGQSGSEATNDLLNLITKLVNPSKEAEKAFNELGIKYGFSAVQASGLAGKIEEIRKKTKGNADAIKELLPDMQAQRGLLSLLTDGNLKYADSLENHNRANDGAGSRQKALNEQMKSAAFQAEKAKQQIQAMAIEIGTHLLPAVRDLLKPVRDITKAFSELDPETQKNVVQFAAMTAGVGFVISKVFGLIKAVRELQVLLAAAKMPPWMLAGAGSVALPAAIAIGAGAVTWARANDNYQNSQKIAAGAHAERKGQREMNPQQLRNEAARFRARAQAVRNDPNSFERGKASADREAAAQAASDAEFVQPGSLRGRAVQAAAEAKLTVGARQEIAFSEKKARELEQRAKQVEAINKKAKEKKPDQNGKGNGNGNTGKKETDEEKRARLAREADMAASIANARGYSAQRLTQDFDSLFGDYKGKYYRKPSPGSKEPADDPSKMSWKVGAEQNHKLRVLSGRIYDAAVVAAMAQFEQDKKKTPQQAEQARAEALDKALREDQERRKRISEKDREQSDLIDQDSRAGRVANLEAGIAWIEGELSLPESERERAADGSKWSDEKYFDQRRERRKGIASEQLAEAAIQAKQSGGGMDEARASYQASLEAAEREYSDSVRNLSEKQRDEAVKRLYFDHDMGEISGEQYRSRLVTLLDAETEYSDRWMSLKRQLHDWDEKQTKEAEEKAKDAAEESKKAAEESVKKAKEAAEERLRIMALEVKTGKRTLESYRDELIKLLALATPYSKEWEELFDLISEVTAKLEKGKPSHGKDYEKEREETFRPLEGFKESIAQELGASIAEFTTWENFFTSWQQRIRRIFLDLVGEIVTNWARVQLGLPGAGGKGETNERGGKSGDGALDAAALIPGAAPVVGAIKVAKKIFGFAEGGVLRPNVPALVGEAGGEFIVPRTPSMAIPMRMLDEIAGRAAQYMGGSSSSVVIADGAIRVQVNGPMDPADLENFADNLAWHIGKRFPAVSSNSTFGRTGL